MGNIKCKIVNVFLISFVIIGLFTGCSEEKADIMFSEINWDDSLSDIIDLHGDYSEKYDSIYGGPAYAFNEYVYNDEKGTLRYFFTEDDKLIAASFVLQPETREENDRIYNKFVEYMREIYGEETGSDIEEDISESLYWEKDSGNIGIINTTIELDVLGGVNEYLIKIECFSDDKNSEEGVLVNTITDNEIKLQEEKEYIKNNVVLADYIVEECTGYSGTVPGIHNISIKNNGDKSISALTVTLDFLTSIGEVKESRDISVIGILDDAIKPGYSWKMENDKFFEIEDLESDTEITRVNVYISDVELIENTNSNDFVSEEEQYITNYLELLDYNVDMMRGYSGIEPGIEKIAIKNTGEKNISEVTVTVFFQDENGNDIAEDSFLVIGGLFDGYGILKANYSWQMESGKYYAIKNLANEVNIYRNRVQITDIEFE